MPLASILLAPAWWRRRVLPPGPLRLFREPFIAIAGGTPCRPGGYRRCRSSEEGHRAGSRVPIGAPTGAPGKASTPLLNSKPP